MQKAAVQKARIVFAKRPQRIQRLELRIQKTQVKIIRLWNIKYHFLGFNIVSDTVPEEKFSKVI